MEVQWKVLGENKSDNIVIPNGCFLHPLWMLCSLPLHTFMVYVSLLSTQSAAIPTLEVLRKKEI